MIMRNTVILVDQIDRDIAAGHARYRAIIDATVRRTFRRPYFASVSSFRSGAVLTV
jgi:hypothetical protein